MGFIAYPAVRTFAGRAREVSPVAWCVAAIFLLRYVLIALRVLPWPVGPLPAP